jgi:FkbM family methyltransferase
MTNPNSVFASKYGNIILSANDKGVCNDIRHSGYFEQGQIQMIIEIIEKMLAKKDKVVFYDVGANIGTHTLAVANTFKDKVFVRSFEAQRQIFYMLCGTVALNGLRNVSCHNLAVGGENGVMDITLPDYDKFQNFGGYELLPIAKSDNQDMVKNIVEQVAVVTLHQFNEPVDFIKMDIEGMEETALKASKEMIVKYRPICFVEIFKSNEGEIKNLFNELGYNLYPSHQDLLAIPQELRL